MIERGEMVKLKKHWMETTKQQRSPIDPNPSTQQLIFHVPLLMSSHKIYKVIVVVGVPNHIMCSLYATLRQN